MGRHKQSPIDNQPGLSRDRDPRSERDDRDPQSASGRRSLGPHRESAEDQTRSQAHPASRFGRDRECLPLFFSVHRFFGDRERSERDLDHLSIQQALLTALSPVLLSLTNLTTLDMSPTTGASTAQVQEELMLCQTWSKYCGLRKVVFPSGDVWIHPIREPEPTNESGGWVLVGGNDPVSSSPSSGTTKPRRSLAEFASADYGVEGYDDPFEGESCYMRPSISLLTPKAQTLTSPLLPLKRPNPTITPPPSPRFSSLERPPTFLPTPPLA